MRMSYTPHKFYVISVTSFLTTHWWRADGHVIQALKKPVNEIHCLYDTPLRKAADMQTYVVSHTSYLKQ